MREKRRALPKLISPLESLDSRIVPSAIGMALARHAAMNARVAAFVSTASVNHANTLARSAALSNLAAARAALAMQAAHPAVATPTVATASTQASTSATVTTPVDKSGPMSKASQVLNAIYQSFVANGSVSPGLAAMARVSGSTVGISVRGDGDLPTLAAELAARGMTVSATDAKTGTFEGSIAIANLPSVANLPQVISLNATLTPQSGPPRLLH
jgi:hypothetical protein